MLDIDEMITVSESTYCMPYSELDDIVSFVRNHEWADIPESIKDHLEEWENFLVENF